MAWLEMMETMQNRVPSAHYPILYGLLFAIGERVRIALRHLVAHLVGH